MIRLALPLVALVVAGCAYDRPGHRPRPPHLERQCTDRGLGSLMGQRRSPSLERKALRLSGARTVRWLRPDSAATMDFRTDRLNLNLNRNDRVISARCG